MRLDDSEAVGGGHAFQGGRVDSGESTAAVHPSLKDSLNSQAELAYTFPLGSSNRPLVDPETPGERFLRKSQSSAFGSDPESERRVARHVLQIISEKGPNRWKQA